VRHVASRYIQGFWFRDGCGHGRTHCAGYTSVKTRGGELKLLHLTKKVRDLLQITKLYTVFEVYSDEPTAVRSFSII
jgi:anti-sigma B factor antagonist